MRVTDIESNVAGREQSRPLRRLPGRTLRLVEFGRSARAMNRRAIGFGLRILATRRSMSATDPEAHALGVQMTSLSELLSESDFVSLHLPHNDGTRHLFAQATLQLKPGSVLINTARGANVVFTPHVASRSIPAEMSHMDPWQA